MMTATICIYFKLIDLLLLLSCVTALVGSSPAERLLHLANSQQRGILLPGVHDALSARIFQRAGVPALFLSGFGVSASKLGVPDAGILTFSEMLEATVSVIASTTKTSTPVIVDGDTGYGSTGTMRRAVRGFAAAGAAAVTIEDQVFPKKCTYAAGAGVCVVDRDMSAARIRTALAARGEALEQDGNRLLIVGRTDCRSALGFEEACERCLIYQELGCDIVYAENLHSPDEYRKLRDLISTPMILAQVQVESQHPTLPLQEVADLGYNFALYGVTALQATVDALETAAAVMLEKGVVDSPISDFENVKKVVGFDGLEAFEHKYYCE